MAGGTITNASILQCPHGAQVQIISSNPSLSAGGAPVATMADEFIISGCPFTIPATPPIPSPCLTIQWLASELRNSANGIPTLSQSSVGICIGATGAPQGPVVIVSTQAGAQSQ
jgi:hypothetical protein